MTRFRRGVALFQLLVILAVIVILIGLLLPAVQKVRIAAARMQSANNLKQLALGVHSYNDAYNTMPSGLDANGFSVHAHLLPYIEQENVYRLIDFKKDALSKENKKGREVLIKTFVSPLDTVVPAKVEAAEPVEAKSFGTNYFGSAGSKHALKDNNGLFFSDTKISLAKISDGTSNTLMFIEGLQGDGGTKATTVARQHVRLAAKDLGGLKEDAGTTQWKDDKQIAGDRGHSWISGKFLQTVQTATRNLNDKKPDVDCGGLGGLSAPRGLIGGVNVALADGSVRFLNEKVSLKTWQAASTRDGGEVIGMDDW